MPTLTAESVGGSQNIIAGLDTVAYSELGYALLAASDNGYNVLVGSTASKPNLFTSYKKHPGILVHVPIRHEHPDGTETTTIVDSTAAGRYQVLNHYAQVYMVQLRLPDFGKVSQDRIALQLFRETGAYELFRAGKFEQAIHAASSRWASFPGAGYDQHENAIEPLLAAYKRAGGTVALS